MKYPRYTDEELDFLREYYMNHTMDETHKAFCEKFGGGYTKAQVKHRIDKCGVDFEKDTKFKKGIVPWNKGQSIKETRPDIYKKYFGRKRCETPCGCINQGVPVGTVTQTKKGFYIVKVAEPSKWIPRAKAVYEEYHNVKLKKGEKLLHLDGDSANDDINNLLLVNNKIICRLNKNGLIFEKGELTKSAAYQQMILQKIKEIEHNGKTINTISNGEL